MLRVETADSLCTEKQASCARAGYGKEKAPSTGCASSCGAQGAHKNSGSMRPARNSIAANMRCLPSGVHAGWMPPPCTTLSLWAARTWTARRQLVSGKGEGARSTVVWLLPLPLTHMPCCCQSGCLRGRALTGVAACPTAAACWCGSTSAQSSLPGSRAGPCWDPDHQPKPCTVRGPRSRFDASRHCQQSDCRAAAQLSGRWQACTAPSSGLPTSGALLPRHLPVVSRDPLSHAL